MRTTGRFSLILIAVLALTALAVYQSNRPSSNANQTSQTFTGMGELRRFEVQQAEAPRVVGIGNLRRLEAQAPASIIPVTGNLIGSRPGVGMGNLRRFESQPSIQNSTTPQSNLPVVIVDLARSNRLDKVDLLPGPAPKGPGR